MLPIIPLPPTPEELAKQRPEPEPVRPSLIQIFSQVADSDAATRPKLRAKGVDQFLITRYAELKAKKEALDITGLLYGPNSKKVEIEKATLRGAIITSGKIKIKKEVDVIYTEADRVKVKSIVISHEDSRRR